MDKQKLDLKINQINNNNKINENKPFKNIIFSNYKKSDYINKNKNIPNSFLFKKKEKDNFQNIISFNKPSEMKKINYDNFNLYRKLINLKTNKKEKKIKLNCQDLKYNKIKNRSCSQDQSKINEKIASSLKNKNNILNRDEEDDNFNDEDVNTFFDKISKEFDDLGKLIKITFKVDEERKYEFIKNEFIILKIIENELKEKYGINIKEFIYKNQKLNPYKTLKDNKLEDNCIIKILID